LGREEIEERSRMKKKILGLEKIEESQRRNAHYRNQLLFEWDKSEDTSKGFVPFLTQEKLYAPKKDILLTESH
jgi:hypothetical protein